MCSVCSLPCMVHHVWLAMYGLPAMLAFLLRCSFLPCVPCEIATSRCISRGGALLHWDAQRCVCDFRVTLNVADKLHTLQKRGLILCSVASCMQRCACDSCVTFNVAGKPLVASCTRYKRQELILCSVASRMQRCACGSCVTLNVAGTLRMASCARYEGKSLSCVACLRRSGQTTCRARPGGHA